MIQFSRKGWPRQRFISEVTRNRKIPKPAISLFGAASAGLRVRASSRRRFSPRKISEHVKRFAIAHFNSDSIVVSHVVANGKPVEASLPCSIQEFLLAQKLLPRSVVVEHNGEA